MAEIKFLSSIRLKVVIKMEYTAITGGGAFHTPCHVFLGSFQANFRQNLILIFSSGRVLWVIISGLRGLFAAKLPQLYSTPPQRWWLGGSSSGIYTHHELWQLLSRIFTTQFVINVTVQWQSKGAFEINFVKLERSPCTYILSARHNGMGVA